MEHQSNFLLAKFHHTHYLPLEKNNGHDEDLEEQEYSCLQEANGKLQHPNSLENGCEMKKV